MSDKEIRAEATKRLTRNNGDCVSLMVFEFSIAVIVILCESTLYLALRSVGYTWLYSLKELVNGRSSTWLFWVSKTVVEFSLVSPCFALVRRLFLDVSIEGDMMETRKYINAHSVKFYSSAFYASLIQLVLKMTAMIPGMLSAYGIYYWAREITINELTSGALFALTACLSTTAVWAFLAGHYFISLAMTPYIMALNPRSNIFDACDLSVKLMEGKQLKYLSFLAYYIKFLPALLLVYPFFALYPVFRVSYSLFMHELMGDKNQDKLPGMIKRWKKYS